KGCTESVAPGAFTDELSSDVRALIDHESRLVLGRTTAGTLELKEDEHGLWGGIDINPNDTEAMNLYARVQRGDVSQCSFGFNILDEEHEKHEDGSHHFTIRKVKLYEVSCCTFPAYEDTSISARKADIEEIEKREADVWREERKKRLKEAMNGTQSTDA
ncbi:MAG: HK97 family phage prohead protease, partial [Firmicutes bacterium]|nr:HK97 family phage prohead protease [Bacillota bacterium]